VQVGQACLEKTTRPSGLSMMQTSEEIRRRVIVYLMNHPHPIP
jgi:hypothetical protein